EDGEKVCPCNQLCRTSSTNTVSGPGGQGPGDQGSGGQNQGQPSPNPPQQGRKGTFTDDLHKLVDNWARDAISLSQGKSRSKQQPSQGHSYQATPSTNKGRKFSAPSQLCPSNASSTPLPLWEAARAPCVPSPVRRGRGMLPLLHCTLQQRPVGGIHGVHRAGTGSGRTPPLPLGAGLLQGFHHISTLQKSVSNPGGPNLRTT
ncbi:serine/threonine-protein kinase WNK1-like, partial [Oncorhynchus keta]|uniref:serine/threonine-protein kinase WNK1-like n=1 Tax=Oncorhynchus keta TaxID=8018 RepID=UPI00227B5830